jgi:hypothetical protein
LDTFDKSTILLCITQYFMAVKKQRKPGEPCQYSLRAMPPDIYKIVIRAQNQIKLQRGINQYSMEQTIYHLIRDWQKCRGGKDIEA